MDKFNNFKAAVTAIVGGISAALGWFGWLVVIYVVCMGLDWFTGTAVAKQNGEWKSDVARAGCRHKIGSVVAFIVSLLFDFLVSLTLHNIPGVTLPFDYSVLLGPVVLVWYIVTEMGSIIENAGLLGAKIPAFLVKAIKVLNSAVDSAGDTATPATEKTE